MPYTKFQCNQPLGPQKEIVEVFEVFTTNGPGSHLGHVIQNI